MIDARCPQCKRLLFRYDADENAVVTIEISCRDCKRHRLQHIRKITIPHPVTGSVIHPAIVEAS